jgi:Amt family ammonium transporter
MTRLPVHLCLLFGLLSGGALAQAEPIDAAELKVALDTVWVLLAAVLVFFMQAGFAMLETGLTRAKNAVNVLMKGISDFCMASIAYWAIGFAIMFGNGGSFFGATGFFLAGGPHAFSSLDWAEIPLGAKFVFQLVFAGAAATIVAGAIAERMKFTGYLIVSATVSALIYPVVGHWIWGGGWLAELGFVDFAGSTVVHSTGAWAGLVGAIILGPRLGKFRGRKANPIPGHAFPFAGLGTFILWLGWFGFNPGSTLAAEPGAIAHIFVTTNLAAAAGGSSAIAFTWLVSGKPDGSMALNGVLGGLVGITAGCFNLVPGAALVVGLLAGVIVTLSVWGLERAGVDDPIGAVSVHGACGVWGTLAVGLLASPALGDSAGLFYGGGTGLLVTQAIGVASVAAWVGGTSAAVFLAVRTLGLLRVAEADEEAGLDLGEHGLSAYAYGPFSAPAPGAIGSAPDPAARPALEGSD